MLEDTTVRYPISAFGMAVIRWVVEADISRTATAEARSGTDSSLHMLLHHHELFPFPFLSPCSICLHICNSSAMFLISVTEGSLHVAISTSSSYLLSCHCSSLRFSRPSFIGLIDSSMYRRLFKPMKGMCCSVSVFQLFTLWLSTSYPYSKLRHLIVI